MKKINDKAVETIFVIAAAFGVLVIVAQILIGTVSGVVGLFK